MWFSTWVWNGWRIGFVLNGMQMIHQALLKETPLRPLGFVKVGSHIVGCTCSTFCLSGLLAQTLEVCNVVARRTKEVRPLTTSGKMSCTQSWRQKSCNLRHFKRGTWSYWQSDHQLSPTQMSSNTPTNYKHPQTGPLQQGCKASHDGRGSGAQTNVLTTSACV